MLVYIKIELYKSLLRTFIHRLTRVYVHAAFDCAMVGSIGFSCTGHHHPVGLYSIAAPNSFQLFVAFNPSYLEHERILNQREMDSGPSGKMGAMYLGARQHFDSPGTGTFFSETIPCQSGDKCPKTVSLLRYSFPCMFEDRTRSMTYNTIDFQTKTSRPLCLAIDNRSAQ